VIPLSSRVVAGWYAPRLTPLAVLLWPLSLVFRAGVALRRALFRWGILRSDRLPVPVVVVGNIAVGGTGKTPLALALAAALAQRGCNPGLVSRGYGGQNVAPRAVRIGDDPQEVGDEPLLLARSGFPVWIGHRRAAAGRELLRAHPRVDVIVADDGLQHYALARNAEIVVVDAARGLGNGLMLPAGPLREPPTRLDEVDAVVRLTPRVAPPSAAHARETTMSLEPQPWRSLVDPGRAADTRAWRPGTVHAIAGIGHPQRFFDLVQGMGITAACHAFPDHHRFAPGDLAFPGATAILMTEKDAVKCAAFADDRCWCLPVLARVDPALIDCIFARLHGHQAA
jgi:tetraacyldisaccharide 4'-kinase